jgi:hydrogenase expression/formation protein HypE
LTQQDLDKAQKLMDEVSIIPEALTLAERGATAMHDVTRGGLLETLLEIAYLSAVGMEVDASRLPIRPVVARFAQALHFDPLRMISSGTLAATVPPDRVADVTDALKKMGIPLADVGRVIEGTGVRLLGREDTIHYRKIQCEEDELTRMWALYPRHQ